MIHKDDLVDFYIVYDRFVEKFIEGYTEVESSFENIKYILDKLLDECFIHDLDIIHISYMVNKEVSFLSNIMENDDFILFIINMNLILVEYVDYLESIEKYEQCSNITNFLDFYNNEIIEQNDYEIIKKNKKEK